MTDQPFLFSDSNFEASCVHVDLLKTTTLNNNLYKRPIHVRDFVH